MKCENICRGEENICGNTEQLRRNKDGVIICAHCFENEYETVKCLKCDCEDGKVLEYISFSKEKYIICNMCINDSSNTLNFIKNLEFLYLVDKDTN